MFGFEIPGDLWGDDFIREVNVWDTNILILIGALVLVTASIFVWAAFLRKAGRHPHYHFPRHAPKPEPREETDKWTLRMLFSAKHRQRRRRHHKRPRNPTLAEAGGLPPVRSEDHPPTPT
jgi:hypothetical protein